MDESVAYCGLTCRSCPIYWATREKDKEKRDEMRAEIARVLKEQYEMEFKPEDITDCDGCRAEGDRLFSGCKKCYIRKCARQKGVDNCAHCLEDPCEKLNEFFTTDPSAKTRLDIIKSKL